MSNFPWKTTVIGSVLLAGTAFVYAQTSPLAGHDMSQMHSRAAQRTDGGMAGMMQHHMSEESSSDMNRMHRQMMHGGNDMHSGRMHGDTGMHSPMQPGQQTGALASPGQGAFGAIQEVVQVLEANPNTDWSKVNIDSLRQHLIDMNEVTLHASATERITDTGLELTITGEGRTLEAIKRMVPAHVAELREIGWNAKTEDLPNGIELTVNASDAQPITKLKALGFMGIMVQGRHQQHHLMMATGLSH